MHGFTWYPHQKNIHITLHVREKKDLIFLPLLSNIWVCVWLCMCEREREDGCACVLERGWIRDRILWVWQLLSLGMQPSSSSYPFFPLLPSFSPLRFLTIHNNGLRVSECVHVREWVCMSEWERERARDRIRCTALAHKKSCCLFCCCRCCSSLTLFIESFFAGKLWNRLEKLTRRVPPKNRNLFTGKMFRQGQKNIGQRTTEKCVDVFDAKRAGKKV